LSACLPFCQRTSRSGQAEAKVFTIMWATNETAAREADLPTIFHKTWQAANPDFQLSSTRRRSPCPGTAALRLALCPSLSQTLELCVGLSRVGLGTKRSWWEVDGKLMRTYGNKRILMGSWWEQKEFDGKKIILMGTRWIWWEQMVFDGLLIGASHVWNLFLTNCLRQRREN
jgi:hypothetical protein